jgi:hypothetical protein
MVQSKDWSGPAFTKGQAVFVCDKEKVEINRVITKNNLFSFINDRFKVY